MTKGATVAKDGRGDAGRQGRGWAVGGGRREADAEAGRTRRRGGRDGKSGARWAGGGIIGGVGGGFVPGVRLAGEFFAEVVRPLLEAEFPGLGYAAALIGAGSEVLGFDSERSTDHDWGPRLLVFLEDEEAERLGVAVDEMLGRRLPEVFGGYPVAFGVTRDPGSGMRHRVEVFGLGGWLAWQLGFDPRGGVTVPDWLAAPWQRLAEVTGGAVFHDGTGGLTRARAALSWYPRDVWRYVLSCQWAGSRRKRRSVEGAPRRATSSARWWSRPGWRAT